jgi:hypothetical protein
VFERKRWVPKRKSEVSYSCEDNSLDPWEESSKDGAMRVYSLKGCTREKEMENSEPFILKLQKWGLNWI